MPSAAVFTSSEDQSRWREHMKHNYTTKNTTSPCVFQVPDNLKETKPEAYTPQVYGLGPYHHFSPQVQHMESEKRKTILDFLELFEVKELIGAAEACPDDFERIIRSCYDRYIGLDKRTLAWVVIVDGLYLWDLICEFDSNKRNKASYGELFMLENQIPIRLIEGSRLSVRCSSSHEPKDSNSKGQPSKLYQSDSNSKGQPSKLYQSFCRDISPLIITEKEVEAAIDTNNHVLHCMYKMIVNSNGREYDDSAEKKKDYCYSANEVNRRDSDDLAHEVNWVRRFARAAASRCQQMGDRVRGNAREAASQGQEIIMEAIEVFNSSLSDAKSAGIKVPGNVETVSNILRNIHRVLDHHLKKHTLGDDQFDIPTASRLKAILKITFMPCCGTRDNILKGNILYLPVITLRPSSEVIFRNLAAYEEMAKMAPTLIRDYLELIGGLVKSEKDVKLLRGAGIIRGEHLPNKEIVRMCNGFTKSDKKPDEESNNNVQTTVKEVKDKFGEVGIVKACRSTMKGFAGCVKFFKPLFPVLVLLFLAFQSFCEIYGCRRRGSSYGGAALHEELDPNDRLMLPRKVYHY